MQVTIETNGYLLELLRELARRIENDNDIYPQAWLTRDNLRGEENE